MTKEFSKEQQKILDKEKEEHPSEVALIELQMALGLLK